MGSKALKQVLNEILSLLANQLVCCFSSGQIKCYCLNHNTNAQGLLGALRINLNRSYTIKRNLLPWGSICDTKLLYFSKYVFICCPSRALRIHCYHIQSGNDICCYKVFYQRFKLLIQENIITFLWSKNVLVFHIFISFFTYIFLFKEMILMHGDPLNQWCPNFFSP